MTNKLKAIGISFLVTVVPALVFFSSCMMAGIIFNNVISDLFFPLSILGIVLCIPTGILFTLSLLGGGKCMEVVNANLVVFKIDGKLYTIDTNPSQTSAAKGGFVLSLFIFLLTVPISVLIWLASSIIMFFNENKANIVIENSKKYFKKMFLLLGASVAGLGLSCVNFGLVGLQDAKYTPEMFNFTYVSLEYDGDDWGGNLLGQSSVYYLRYEFQNTGKIKGGLEGDIIIEGRDGTKLELKDKVLSVYPSNERDFEKHLVEDYFYVSKSDVKTNDMLKSNSNDIKITLVIKVAGWEGGSIEPKVREYDEGKQVVLKNFGETSGSQQPGQPPQQGGTSGGVQTTEQKYQQAISLYNNGKYAEALEIFEDLNNYKQSADYIDACEEKLFYVQMENELVNVAGSNAILPDNYLLQTSYSANEYILYNGNYYLGFYADFYCHRLDMQEYINNFITKLINNGYSYVSDGVYKKANTIVQFSFFEGDDYFTYQAFKIS